MIFSKLFKHSREAYVMPEVTQAEGLELEHSLLVNSPGKDMSSLIVSTGHDTSNYDAVNGNYWE